MSPRVPLHGIEVLDGYIARTRDFMNDWLRFNQLLGAYTQPSVNRLQLETHFLQLKSKLARDHRVLSDRLGPDCKFTLDVINIISSATSLESIFAQSDVAVKKLQSEWHRSFITVNETLGNLEDKHKRAEAGERVNVGGLWIQTKIKKPFPWKKSSRTAAARWRFCSFCSRFISCGISSGFGRPARATVWLSPRT